jgi:hypothetical protein
VHLSEDEEFRSAGIARCSVFGKIPGFSFVRLVIKVRNQIFSPMANRTFIILFHLDYLAFANLTLLVRQTFVNATAIAGVRCRAGF